MKKNRTFKLQKSYTAIGFGSLAWGLLMFGVLYTGWEIDEPGEWKPVLAMAVCFTLASLYLIPASLSYAVTTSAQGISVQQLFTKERSIKWKDVTDVSISMKPGRLFITDKYKTVISIMFNLGNVHQLLEIVKANVGAESITYRK